VTRARDRKSLLINRRQYLPHPDDGCAECKAMKDWLDGTIRDLSK
jgi:predicted dithiol-disulfide oxidoreductase (DUF899 family)